MKFRELAESTKSDKLATAITKVMIKIDDSMGYEDFAIAIGKILTEDYGKHNYEPFLTKLKKELK